MEQQQLPTRSVATEENNLIMSLDDIDLNQDPIRHQEGS